ncbi:MAG TPA: dihydroorotate oxidase [Hyphomicrobium sp.]|nr:dihydroorotate oxidase [Hyphomicrobium sp.]HRO48685.1 dihydroorotate oxidase [Hyphomicrobium sp.]
MTHGLRENVPRPAASKPATSSSRAAAVSVMGLAFPNTLGLAAGFDRTGELLPSLLTRGFGHVEIGTLTPSTGQAGALARGARPMRVGINIGSDRPGLDERVIADYIWMLERASKVGDYVVANLTASGLHRDGNTAGVETLVRRLAVTRGVCEAVLGRRLPLLLKIEGGAHHAPFPAAIMAARLHGLDGVVLVSDCLDRIRAVSEYLNGSAVISVGGVRAAGDVRARLAAGASLVQVHRVFADCGPARIRRILRDLATRSA